MCFPSPSFSPLKEDYLYLLTHTKNVSVTPSLLHLCTEIAMIIIIDMGELGIV
jgi:hypothetical protein